jgi:hypothetical protein
MHMTRSAEMSSYQQALELAERVEQLLAERARRPSAHPRVRTAVALAQSLVDEIALVATDSAA